LTARLRAVGIPIADHAKILTTTVVGTDKHPLAVAISKANYILATKDVWAVNQEALVIPIFLDDTNLLTRKL